MKIAAIASAAWDVPMRSPYRSAQRITTTARNVLVTLRLDDGALGYGESAPAAYVTGETQETVLMAAHALAAELRGREEDEAAAVLAAHLPESPGAGGALEMALFDAAARSRGVPLYRFLGAAADTAPRRVTDLSLPILPAAEAGERAARAASAGFRALKLKVGSGDADADRARVRAVAEAAPGAALRLDGNQGFAPEEAVRFLGSLDDLAARIDLFEQPTRADDEPALRFVAERVRVPVYADESVTSADDARHLVASGVCAGVVLKLAKSGLSGVRAIAEAVADAGGQCLFGCMMETRVGIGAALHLALALGPKAARLDLDGHLLVDDAALVRGGLRQEADALIADPTASGLGLVARAAAVL